jgi:hypothetical protein
MPGSTRASRVISSRRSSAPSNKAGKQGRQTRPDCRAQCRGAAVSCLRPQPRHRRNRVLELHLHRRSTGSTSASPAISGGSGPPRPQISAAPSISARRESPHDPRRSQSVRPLRCLNNARRYALSSAARSVRLNRLRYTRARSTTRRRSSRRSRSLRAAAHTGRSFRAS